MHERSSNSPHILQVGALPHSHHLAVNLGQNNIEAKPEKALVLQWDTQAGTLSFNVGMLKNPHEIRPAWKDDTRR